MTTTTKPASRETNPADPYGEVRPKASSVRRTLLQEQDAIEERLYCQSAEYLEMIRWRDMPRRRKFTKEMVEAREEWSLMCGE